MAELLRVVPHDHPALPGHFPGAPVLPGVVLLDWAWECCALALPAGTRLRGLHSAKFLHAVRPGDALCIGASVAAGHADFTIHLGEQLAARGRFLHGEGIVHATA